MAGAGVKRRIEENSKRLRQLRLALGAGTAFYFVVRIVSRHGQQQYDTLVCGIALR